MYPSLLGDVWIIFNTTPYTTNFDRHYCLHMKVHSLLARRYDTHTIWCKLYTDQTPRCKIYHCLIQGPPVLPPSKKLVQYNFQFYFNFLTLYKLYLFSSEFLCTYRQKFIENKTNFLIRIPTESHWSWPESPYKIPLPDNGIFRDKSVNRLKLLSDI